MNSKLISVTHFYIVEINKSIYLDINDKPTRDIHSARRYLFTEALSVADKYGGKPLKITIEQYVKEV